MFVHRILNRHLMKNPPSRDLDALAPKLVYGAVLAISVTVCDARKPAALGIFRGVEGRSMEQLGRTTVRLDSPNGEDVAVEIKDAAARARIRRPIGSLPGAFLLV